MINVPVHSVRQERLSFSFLHVLVLFSPRGIVWCPRVLGRAHCFPESTDSNVSFTWKEPYGHTQRWCLAKYLDTPLSSQVDTYTPAFQDSTFLVVLWCHAAVAPQSSWLFLLLFLWPLDTDKPQNWILVLFSSLPTLIPFVISSSTVAFYAIWTLFSPQFRYPT